MFRHIFEGLESRYAKELAVIREQYPSEPVQFTEKPLIIHWAEGMEMLRQAGHQVGRFKFDSFLWCWCSISYSRSLLAISGCEI